MTVTSLTISTPDGLALEAERATPPDGVPTRCAVVLCHPHPQFGGSMRAVVVSPLFAELPAHGADCLRFNFRGVEGSQGTYDNGIGERVDAQAAVSAQHAAVPGVALVCLGFSFGADVAQHVVDGPDAWVLIAPPLRSEPAPAFTDDPRPKLVVLAEHDDFRALAEAQAITSTWRATRIEVVPGASHFFVGRQERVTELDVDFLATL
jgi:alpha/beta superfamily hydrolase